MEEVILMGYITREKHISERVIDPDGICFTLMAMILKALHLQLTQWGAIENL